MLDDRQVVGRQPGGRVAFQAGLHEHLDRRERVADFVGDAGRHLADGRQLLGAEHLALALLELLDDALDLFDHALHLPVQARQVALFVQRHRPQLAVEPAGGVADAHAQLVDRVPQAAGDQVAQQQPAQRPAQADGDQAPLQLLHDAAVGPVGRLDLVGVVHAQLMRRGQDVVLQVFGQIGPAGAVLVPEAQVRPDAVADPVHEGLFVFEVGQVVGLLQQLADVLVVPLRPFEEVRRRRLVPQQPHEFAGRRLQVGGHPRALHVLGQHGGDVEVEVVEVERDERTGRDQHQADQHGGGEQLER